MKHMAAHNLAYLAQHAGHAERASCMVRLSFQLACS